MQPIKVCVVGGSGYTGAELLRLILNHPAMQLCAVYAHTLAGKSLRQRRCGSSDSVF
jgi:N-acetyl-gamma-glutamyl-phosphate reductase